MHTTHFLTNLAMSFSSLGQKKFAFTRAKVFASPKCPPNVPPCDFFFFFFWIIKNLFPKRPMAKQTIRSKTRSQKGYQNDKQTDSTSPKNIGKGHQPETEPSNQTPQTGKPSISTSIPTIDNSSPQPGHRKTK